MTQVKMRRYAPELGWVDQNDRTFLIINSFNLIKYLTAIK